MAGRYSKEYRPSEFVKLPFEEVAKVMAMKEQQYQQGYLQPAAYQQEMGKVEVRTPDIEYHQQLIKQATDKARQLAEETYGGDYGAAASDITRTLANEANNPFYSWTKSKMDEYKKAKDIQMKLKAEGKYIGFDEGLLNTAYYDDVNNKYNTNLTTNIQEKLDYEKQRQDIWNYAIQEEGGSHKGKLANAETEAKAGRLFLEIPKTSWQGVKDEQVKRKYAGALAQYMSTVEYDQEKALLVKNGFTDEQADKQIAGDMLKSGMLKTHMITKDDSQILNNPLGKTQMNGGDTTSRDVPIPQETQNLKIKKDNNFISGFEQFKNKFLSKFKPIAETKDKERQNIVNQINSYTNDYINRVGVSSTDKLYATREIAKLREELKKMPTKYSNIKTSELSQKDKDEIINQPIFKGMTGVVKNILSSVDNLEQANFLLENITTSIKNNSATSRVSHKMSFNSPDQKDNILRVIKRADVDGFKATDEGGGKGYNKSSFLKLLSEDKLIDFEVRGDGKFIFYVNDDGKEKSIALEGNVLPINQQKALKAINAAEDAFYSYANVDGVGTVKGDQMRITIKVPTSQGDFYPKITPGNEDVEMIDDSGKTVGILKIGEVIDSYHRGLLGTSVKYNLSTNIYK